MSETPDWAQDDEEIEDNSVNGNEEAESQQAPEPEPETQPESEAVEGEVVTPEEQPAGLLSPRDLELQKYTQEWTRALSAQIGQGISASDAGVLIIEPDVEDETIFSALEKTVDALRKGDTMGEILELAIGRLVLEVAARTSKDLTETVSDLELCESLNRSDRTILNWARVVQVIPEDCFCFQLTMSHYTIAASYKAPEAAQDRSKFSQARAEILREAAKDPKTKNTTYVRNSMRALKAKFFEEKEIKEPIKDITYRLIEMFRVRDAIDAGAGDLGDRHERRDLIDHIESDVNELINRGVIEAELDSIVFSFSKPEDEEDEGGEE